VSCRLVFYPQIDRSEYGQALAHFRFDRVHGSDCLKGLTVVRTNTPCVT
jgi:hypothetical protein